MLPNSDRPSALPPPARLSDPRALYVLSVVDRIGDIRDDASLARLLAVDATGWPTSAVRAVVEQILSVMPERDLDPYVAIAAAAIIDTEDNLREGEIEADVEQAAKPTAAIRSAIERWCVEGNVRNIKRVLEPLGWRDNLTARSIDELARLAMVLVDHETPERVALCAEEVEFLKTAGGAS